VVVILDVAFDRDVPRDDAVGGEIGIAGIDLALVVAAVDLQLAEGILFQP